MGLLGRRNTHHHVSTLKKPQNGADQSMNNGPSQSSLLAAQAATSLFQNSNSSSATQSQIPPPSNTTQELKKPGLVPKRSVSMSHAPTVRQKPVSSVKNSPLSYSNNNHTQLYPNIDHLSLNDSVHIEERPSPVCMRSRSPAPPARMSVSSQQSQQSIPPNPATTLQAIASAAAKSAATSAANSTADLLAPPPNPHSINKVYPSSPSISLGSSNSLDSAPFSLRPPTFNKSSSDIAGSVPEIHHPPPRFFFDSDNNCSDYFEPSHQDRQSIRSSSAGSDYLGTPKSQRPSGGSSTHLGLDTIPSRIDEHELEYEYESELNEYEFDDYSDIDGPQSQIDLEDKSNQPRIARPFRKPPPPDSPLQSYVEGPYMNSSSSLSPSVHPNMVRRNTSPRRKPPPGSPYLEEYDTESVINDEDDPLPQYPLSVEDQEKRRRSHHHGFRKNAKNILKKGFKGASSTANPSTYLNNNSNNEEPKTTTQFKTTMRKEKKKKKSTFNEDKPWKHHGDREYITEQERKRYDGLWVANKGLYMDLVDPSTLNISQEEAEHNTALKASIMSTKSELPPLETNLMLNLVVRDIWSRSRLPPDSLRQIWDLVDTRGDGTLERKSFIIGMWLVDQCLYGRKLPKQLDESVWNSISQLGVNVIIKPKKARK